MNYGEALVGSIALVAAIASLAIAVGPWGRPYQLSTISAISRRFGKPAARGVWLAIAIALLTAGSAIVAGLRPSYASPAQRATLDR